MAKARSELRAGMNRLSRNDWLVAAREALIEEGKDGVKVERLAKRLNVTRGGFYWHFRDRDDLCDALLRSWERETNKVFEEALKGDHKDGLDEFLALCRIWINEDVYSPTYDSAMRDWARVSKRAEKAVRRVDKRRIDILKRIYQNMDCDEDEAFIRARIMYFHQVGYYTLGIGESKPERRRLLPRYVKALTGKDVTYEEIFPDQ